MSNQANSDLPHWDMTTIFPSLGSPEFGQAFDAVVTGTTRLTELFDANAIGKRASTPVEPSTIGTFEKVIGSLNALLDQWRVVSTYINSFVTTDSRDNAALGKMSELQMTSVGLSMLDTRLTSWIGSMDVESLIEKSSIARDHAFMLRKTKIESSHQMSPAEEELAAELRPSGSTAWAKLHGMFTSQLTVPVELDAQVKALPMSMVRNLASDPDRSVRRRAYLAELAAWRQAAVPLAAALNSIKGASLVTCKRRGWASPLDESLFDNNVDRQTLDAMMGAARESFPMFRRYLHAKALVLKVPEIAWYDLTAPLPNLTRTWSFDDGSKFIINKFREYSPKLGQLGERAFRERWIDAEPREGKRDGAFCMSVRGDESRILANFKPSFPSVGTLAHELGHAYHNVNLASRSALQKQTPMTLAETASIFCQRLVLQAGLRAADPQEQMAILEESLQDACQVVVDISSRFLFERQVFEMRQRRELSVDELDELMLQSQRETYGNGLDPSALHPHMWCVKQHYYQTNYYNYPYMFGLLFGLGLFARYDKDPEQFRAVYDDLLSSTGMADAAALAARFGIDTHSPDFWQSSLNVIGRDIERFEQLAARQEDDPTPHAGR